MPFHQVAMPLYIFPACHKYWQAYVKYLSVIFYLQPVHRLVLSIFFQQQVNHFWFGKVVPLQVVNGLHHPYYAAWCNTLQPAMLC